MSDSDAPFLTDKPEVKAKAAPKKPAPKTAAKEPTPRVGRIVRYVTASGGVRPAIIAGLVEEGLVQVVVFNSSGSQFANDVAFAPEEDRVPGTVHWPEI